MAESILPIALRVWSLKVWLAHKLPVTHMSILTFLELMMFRPDLRMILFHAPVSARSVGFGLLSVRSSPPYCPGPFYTWMGNDKNWQIRIQATNGDVSRKTAHGIRWFLDLVQEHQPKEMSHFHIGARMLPASAWLRYPVKKFTLEYHHRCV